MLTDDACSVVVVNPLLPDYWGESASVVLWGFAACSQLIHSLVTVHIDYCNSLLYGMPDSTLFRLQKVLNTTARILKKIPKFSHITDILFFYSFFLLALASN